MLEWLDILECSTKYNLSSVKILGSSRGQILGN